ncbi:hypothetical protein O181_046652 [Austropuccinia psidii MF-1]|uniref:Uncharacterized protein n=1 Tax=Austropuccinia psidii MF-1 TaxID=1389203 RepID=A0A9Q3HJW4_9BASI|nr:hypothetical protein [Austropuccinia psidii MF-1]
MPLRSGKFVSFNDSESSDSDSIVEQLVPTSRPDIKTVPLPSVSAFPMDYKLVQEQSHPSDYDMISPAFSLFLKNPCKFVSNVPQLWSDGSNFADWTKGLDNIFMYIFNKILFTNDLNHSDLFPQAKGALCFFLQQTIASDLSEMIQNEASPRLAFVEIQRKFKKSTRLTQLDLVIEFFDMYDSIQSLKPNDIFSHLFLFFDKFKRIGIPLSTEWKSLIAQVFAPVPSKMTRHSCLHFISVELDRLDKIEPRDVQQLVSSYLVLVKREDKGESSQSVMKLAPKNKVPTKTIQMENLTSSMAKFVISSSPVSASEPGATQVKSLCTLNNNKIKQAHLNIKLGNRQPSMALRQNHGMECHYCKYQGLAYLGHWVSTCPIIWEILKLEKAPHP